MDLYGLHQDSRQYLLKSSVLKFLDQIIIHRLDQQFLGSQLSEVTGKALQYPRLKRPILIQYLWFVYRLQLITMTLNSGLYGYKLPIGVPLASPYHLH